MSNFVWYFYIYTCRFPFATVDYDNFVRTHQRVRESIRPVIPHDSLEAHTILEGSPFFRYEG